MNEKFEKKYYADFDGDGISEKIRIIYTFTNIVSIQINKNDKIIDQWNIDGQLINTEGNIWGDIDNDNIKELFVFTWSNNNIILNYFNPLVEESKVQKRIISDFKPRFVNGDKSGIGCTIHILNFTDQNNDGYKELYFTTEISFATHPRKMFAYDFTNNKLHSSPKSCAGLNTIGSYDIDGDGELEFIGTSNAVGNCKPDDPFSDIYSWLMVFDKEMNFKFQPIKLGDYPSNSKFVKLKTKEGISLVCLNVHTGANKHHSKIYVFNSHVG